MCTDELCRLGGAASMLAVEQGYNLYGSGGVENRVTVSRDDVSISLVPAQSQAAV